MKKQLKVAFAAALSVCLLGSMTACTKKESAPAASAPAASAPAASAPAASAPAAEPAKDAVTVKLAHVGAPDHIFEVGALKFQELVSEATSGGIFVQTYPGSQLGADRDITEGLQIGTIEFGILGTFDHIVPITSAIALPFMYASYEQVDAFLDSDFAADTIYAPLVDTGIYVLSHMQNGFRFITSNKPIEKVADLKGLKIRTPETDLYVKTFQALGASPVPIAFNELYSALQQGVVEAQENPTAHIVTQKFYEVQSCVAKSNHIFAEAPLCVSTKYWGTLDADTQAMMEEKAYEATLYQREVSRSREQDDLKLLTDNNITITDIDYDEFFAATQSVRDEWAATNGQDIYDSILEIVNSAK